MHTKKIVMKEQLIERRFGHVNIRAHNRTEEARRQRPDLNRAYIVPVLGKALKIIDLLEKSDHHVSINELTEKTGIAKTTVYRIVRTLYAYGYLSEGKWNLQTPMVNTQEEYACE